jgi:hypothetical protein
MGVGRTKEIERAGSIQLDGLKYNVNVLNWEAQRVNLSICASRSQVNNRRHSRKGPAQSRMGQQDEREE